MFLIIFEFGIQRLGAMMVGFLVKALFLVHKDHLFVCSFGSEKEAKLKNISTQRLI